MSMYRQTVGATAFWSPNGRETHLTPQSNALRRAATVDKQDLTTFYGLPFDLAMERYFMSRTSAVALLVDARRAVADGLSDKPAHEAARDEFLLKTIERLLLDVRVGRRLEFDLEYPTRLHVIISD